MRLHEGSRSTPDAPGIASIDEAANIDGRDDASRLERVSDIRVLHVAQKLIGGIASYFEEIAPYQNDAFGKANVSFMIPSGSEGFLPCVDPAQIITFASTGRQPRALRTFGQEAREVIRRIRPDIVHLHSSFAGAVIRTFLPSGPGRPRVIYCPHGWAFSMEISNIHKLVYAAVERYLARETDLIVVNSASEYDLAVEFGLPRQKLRMVRNGIAWMPLLPKRRATTGMQLAFIGRHDRQKGLDVLLDTIRRHPLPDIHFHIVGEPVLAGGGSADIGARNNVTFHGWLDRAQTMALLCDVDAVVMPSRWEAFGLVAIEAMRAGVAVIGSNRGALPEVIRDGVGGYVFDLDDAGALGRLLNELDPRELRRLGASARSLWEREYVADRMNQLVHQSYEEVLVASAAPTSVPSVVSCGSAAAAAGRAS